MSLDKYDQQLFRDIHNLKNTVQDSLEQLFQKSIDLDDTRGTNGRHRKYRKRVLNWIQNNTSEMKKPNGKFEYHSLEFEFERNKKKRKRTYYSKRKLNVPNNVLRLAFLSGKSNRLKQIRHLPSPGGVEELQTTDDSDYCLTWES